MRLARLCVLSALVSVLWTSPHAWGQPTRQDNIKLSPTSLSAVQSGLTVTEATIRRWIAATELSEEQLKMFGFGIGTLGEEKLRAFIETSEDRQARRFIEHYDSFAASTLIQRDVSSSRVDKFPKGWGDSFAWQELSLRPFVDDAVELGRFTTEGRAQLSEALRIASQASDSLDTVRARATASRMLDEARRAGVKRARGYKLLVDAVKKEMEGRDFVQSIALVVEVGSGDRQPTIAPLTISNLLCTGGPQGELVFTQRQRDCSDRGVCKVDSVASVLDNPSYKAVFKALEGEGGRKYLDSCKLKTTMLIDGVEIERTISGRFISHSPQVQR